MSIIVDKISYTYEIGTGFERQALKEVSCVIEKGEFIGLIGHTGSGKSTFIQHLNGLVKATSGAISKMYVLVLKILALTEQRQNLEHLKHFALLDLMNLFTTSRRLICQAVRKEELQ